MTDPTTDPTHPTTDARTTAPAPEGTAGAWVVEATLVTLLAAHLLLVGAMRASAAAMPLFFAQACLLGPLGLLAALAGAREAVRRRAGRGRLAALVLLVGAATILPGFAEANLAAGAARDLERAGGAEVLVREGRALLAGRGGAPPGYLTAADWPLLGRFRGTAWADDVTLRVPCFGVGDYGRGQGAYWGFVVQAPGAPPVGRRIADGLSWWSHHEHGGE
ncbi:MAG: hypothetical protein M9894_35890 [Planctomycetes bacterium]|nr:hypothetical protein [Planctomycetota bacterium]